MAKPPTTNKLFETKEWGLSSMWDPAWVTRKIVLGPTHLENCSYIPAMRMNFKEATPYNKIGKLDFNEEWLCFFAECKYVHSFCLCGQLRGARPGVAFNAAEQYGLCGRMGSGGSMEEAFDEIRARVEQTPPFGAPKPRPPQAKAMAQQDGISRETVEINDLSMKLGHDICCCFCEDGSSCPNACGYKKKRGAFLLEDIVSLSYQKDLMCERVIIPGLLDKWSLSCCGMCGKGKQQTLYDEVKARLGRDHMPDPAPARMEFANECCGICKNYTYLDPTVVELEKNDCCNVQRTAIAYYHIDTVRHMKYGCCCPTYAIEIVDEKTRVGDPMNPPHLIRLGYQGGKADDIYTEMVKRTAPPPTLNWAAMGFA